MEAVRSMRNGRGRSLEFNVNREAFPGGSVVKNLPAMKKTQDRSLGWEDPLEKAMAPHSSTLAWKIPWTEELGRLQSMGSQRVRHNLVTKQQQNKE